MGLDASNSTHVSNLNFEIGRAFIVFYIHWSYIKSWYSSAVEAIAKFLAHC